MRKVLKDSGRPCGEKRVHLTVITICVLDIYEIPSGDLCRVLGTTWQLPTSHLCPTPWRRRETWCRRWSTWNTQPTSHKMTSDTRCFTPFIGRLSSEMHNYRSYNFHIFPFLDFNSALTHTEEMPEKRSSQMHLASLRWSQFESHPIVRNPW